MHKFLITLLLAGWFFAYQVPASSESPLIRTVVGPFLNKAQCEAYKEDLMGMFEAFGIPAQVQKECVERKDA
jgi:hypothetical protein